RSSPSREGSARARPVGGRAARNMHGNVTRILAVSGSLRARSSNTAALAAASRVAPDGVLVQLYDGLATLPHFNPDHDEEGAEPPAPVAGLRTLIAGADGVLLSTPEYAHGLPGVLKNALDWLV